MKKLIEWNDKYSTGIKIIDFQHKKVIKCVNLLNYACEKIKSRKKIPKLINCLDFYATFHFETEESFMLKFNYEKYKEHKEVHEHFKSIYNQIKNNYIYKKNEAVYILAIHLTYTLAEWLNYHLEHEDKEFVEFLKEKIKEV